MYRSRVALFRSGFTKTVSTAISLALIFSVSQATDASAVVARIISHSAITLTLPVAGATPATSATDNFPTVQFAGTVTWGSSPSQFGANTSYTATITLTPTSSPQWSWPSSVSGFTVTGATSVTNDQPVGARLELLRFTRSSRRQR